MPPRLPSRLTLIAVAAWATVRAPAGSAFIVPPDSAQFLVAALRPRQQWADDMPTFDVSDSGYDFSTSLLYPSQIGQLVALDARYALPWLTPPEYMSLYETLPPSSAFPATNNATFAPLFAWERANPGLARRFPASEILTRARSGLAAQDSSRAH